MFFLVLISLLPAACHGDIFTAMADMENLLGAEKEVSSLISAYVDSEMSRLEHLRKFAEEYSKRNAEALEAGSDYVTNPVNAYLLIKRLTSDWKFVESMMSENNAEHFLRNITARREFNQVKYPQDEDLAGAAIALLRLQDTYQLDTEDLASGNILGHSINKELTSHDCFEVGRAAYNQRDYYHTVLWMQEAQRRAERELPPMANLGDILEYLAFALFKQGNVKRALALTKRLVVVDPHHPRAAGNVKWYEDMLDEASRKTAELPPLKLSRAYDGVPERDAYEAQCRGENQERLRSNPKLHCYLKMDRPFLRLAPIKVEILGFDPLVVLFKEIISDYEISIVESLAIPKLRRATVQNAQTGDLETATYRISKSAWLRGQEHPVVDALNKRFDMMTNLNQETSEDLQAQNYGIGGHYDPHYDFARKEETNAFKTLNTGNRIATILVYMSEVDSGGATVFSDLDMAVFPSKGDALFWYNLKRSGEGDMRTRHAACPVLTGIKWVSNKWVHERGQEFRRPCGLTEDATENYVGDLSS